MISISPGYKTPRFNGLATFGDLTSPINVLPAVETAVFWGGVPLCAWILVTKGGLSSWLAGALGAGLVYLKLQEGSGGLFGASE